MRVYAVYILASFRRVLYIGVTSDLKRRVWQHRNKFVKGFTALYMVDRLVYYEVYHDVWRALEREKHLKGWRRARKIELIATHNPEWRDLYDEI